MREGIQLLVRGLQFGGLLRHPLGGAGATPEGAADFVLRVMAFGELLDQANPAARKTVHAQLIGLFAQGRTGSEIAMPAKAFLVTARA